MHYTLEQALAGSTAPGEILERLVLLDVPHVDLEGHEATGQLVVHRALADEVREIFDRIHDLRFPIAQMVPTVAYDWDDDRSMAANNTSSFCYRTVAGTKRLSAHSVGAAIDINPAFNPFDSLEGLRPEGAVHDLSRTGTFHRDHAVVKLFEGYGWFWLGTRLANTDRHHFEKIGYRDSIALAD
ncbi:MAG TPA: M15 family metallopeptidase [Candidatus Saccharimonas sp.]|nr:M15 family metallopeptidase [Candidatus Saccharimonas sp.]